MADFKGYFLTMAAAFVLYFCVHDQVLFRSIPFFKKNKAVFFSGEAVPRHFGTAGKYRR